MRVSEIRVKRIRVNQGLGVDPKQFWTIKSIFDWFKIFGTWFKEQKSVLKSHCQ